MIAHVWDDLNVEISSSKDTNLLFREQGFERTPQPYTEDRVLSTQDTSMLDEFAKNQTEIARQLIRKVKEAKVYGRGDYKACLDLMEVYIVDNSKYNFF